MQHARKPLSSPISDFGLFLIFDFTLYSSLFTPYFIQDEAAQDTHVASLLRMTHGVFFLIMIQVN